LKKWATPNEAKERITKTNTGDKGKKPYRPPRLVVYGDLGQVTRGGGGTRGDGGSAHSKLK
jgi:hypothetical protein